jgi:four helix bundle protein
MTKQGDAGVGYKKLKIYQLAHDLGLRIHRMTLDLPKFEMFEEGSQIRRSSKSVSSNVIEGYSLRKYKAEYIHYLFRAYASSMETVEHLEYLHETNSMKDANLFNSLMSSYSELNSMLYRFIEAVDREHNPDILYERDGYQQSDV